MFPFLAAISQAGGIIIDKIVLTRQRVELKIFLPILFIMLFIFSALLCPWLSWIRLDLFTPKYIAIFCVMILVAIVWNIYYYRGAKAEKVHELELIMMAQPIITILLASTFISSERNWPVVAVAIIAGVVLMLSRVTKEHLTLSGPAWGLIIAALFMSVELILIKYLLVVFSPVLLYTIRTGILAIFFFLTSKPHFKMISKENYALIGATAFLGTASMVTKFYGFDIFGVVYTSLILILAPVLVYIASAIVLHEKIKMKTVLAAVLILFCIVFATVYKQSL